MDDLKELGGSEEDCENEIKIVKAIIEYINISFVLEKSVKICFEKGRVQNTTQTGRTFK
jgi:hypothetical protein